MANMVALGAYIWLTGIVPLDIVKQSLKKVILPHYAKMIPANEQALQAGAESV